MGNNIQTIEITNFGGRLTRKVNGDLNSGLTKFLTSWGYDPFSKPDNLTWLEAPVDITGPISDLILDAKPKSNTTADGQMYIYAIGNSGKLYKIQPNSIGSSPNPNVDSVIGISSVTSGGPAYNYGASMEFFGQAEKIYVASDSQINKINFDGTADTVVTSTNLVQNYHPLKSFGGGLRFGNGNTIGTISAATGTVTSSVIGTGQGNIYSELNPPLGVEEYVHDLDLSVDGNYLLITASNLTNEAIGVIGDDYPATSGSAGFLHRWNGSDVTVTSTNSIPSYAVTALQTYLQNNMFFSSDSFGSSLNDGTNKILTLQNNKSPLPNATTTNGNFICWITPEVSSDNTKLYASMYYFGGLDQENPPGLYRVMRYSTTLANGFVYQTPLNVLTNNMYSALNSSRSSVVTAGYGKHYFSTWETSNATQNSYKFYRFLITPSGTGTPQLGVYETQNQIFSKRITVKQIRVYTEPTVSGNGFQVDLIGSGGSVISNSWNTNTYTFAAGTDPTKLQGSLQRIDFTPVADSTYSLGIRITNTGTTNMTIKKIEVDVAQSGK